MESTKKNSELKPITCLAITGLCNTDSLFCVKQVLNFYIRGFSNYDITNNQSINHLALQPFVGSRLLRQVSPSSSALSCFFPIFNFQFFRSSTTSSCHRCLGLPIGLVPIGFQSNSFLVGLAWSIL